MWTTLFSFDIPFISRFDPQRNPNEEKKQKIITRELWFTQLVSGK